jgi:RNA polymerase subunit RPABC4/transcription elongation factor Spt4
MSENQGKTKICKKCKEQINKKAKKCPHCGAKQGISTWLIIVIVIFVIGIIASIGGNEESGDNNKYEKNKGSKVTVVDFSSMTEAEIDTWCDDNKINCSVTQEYSDSIDKNGFISQSVDADKTIYEGDKIEIVFSLGKEPTTGQKNALKKAESYSSTMHMSKAGIYKQLTSEYGEGFTAEEAQYAIDNINADWNANALAKAKSYQSSMSMSKSAIYEQLTSEYGEEFTAEEAQYAIDHLDD